MLINNANLRTLDVGFKAAFADGFATGPTDHQRLMMDVSSDTASEEYGWLGQFPGLRKWVGEMVYDGIEAHGYSIVNDKYVGGIEIDRDKIEDDKFGVYAPIMREMGRAAADHPAELVFSALRAGFDTKCYDGQYFFDTDHPPPAGSKAEAADTTLSNTGGGNGQPWFLIDTKRMIKPIIFQRRRDYQPRSRMDLDDPNVWDRDMFAWKVDGRCAVGYGLWQLAFGSKQPLTAENYAAARRALLDMVGDQNRPLGIMPDLLLTTPSNEAAARKILLNELTTGGETNEWRGTAEPMVNAWLTDR